MTVVSFVSVFFLQQRSDGPGIFGALTYCSYLQSPLPLMDHDAHFVLEDFPFCNIHVMIFF